MSTFPCSHRVRDVPQAEDTGSTGPPISAHVLVFSGPALGQEPALDVGRASRVGVRLVVPVRSWLLDRQLDEDLFVWGKNEGKQ